MGSKKNKVKNTEKVTNNSVGLSYIISVLLLLAYGFVTVLTPNLHTFDSNGPKFLSLSILNLVVVLILFGYKEFREDKQKLFGFFTNRMGIAYTLMMIMAMLSFTKAINLGEAILHFSKILTGFITAWFVSVLVYTNKKAILPLALALATLLIWDSFQTFGGVSDIIKDKIGISQVKGTYSNKNILTSAMFIKLPFALWIFFFFKGWKKLVGLLGLFLGTLAIFFMNTRAFYLATVITFILLCIYSFIYYKRNQKPEFLFNSVYYLGILVVAFSIFYFTITNIYPKSRQYDFFDRIESIRNTAQEAEGNGLRLKSWNWSLQMIKKDPLLGVGVGNWKIRILEYENKENSGYIYMYKNHNDFLEIPAELGIIAGLAFISIFLFAGWYLIMALFKRKNREEQQFFFLPAFGLFAYSFDAFFNFPQDRPEMQSLFAIHVGIGVGLGLTYYGKEKIFNKLHLSDLFKKFARELAMGLTILVLCGGTYVLYMYFESLKVQRMVKEEAKGVRKPKSSAQVIMDKFPPIPNQTAVLESIEIEKARYLLDEKKYEKARELLREDHSSPWDGRREYYLALSYYFPEKKNLDSILYYARKAKEVKPLFHGNSNIISYALEAQGKTDEAIELWEEYTSKVKTEPQAWNTLAALYEKKGNVDKAIQTLDSAFVYLPSDETIIKNRDKIHQSKKMGEYLPMYSVALQHYNNKNYETAYKGFTDFLNKVPDYAEAYGLRAVCNYRLGKYQQALDDMASQEKYGNPLNPIMTNIKASCYYFLGDINNAKIFFKKAKDAGDKDAISNYKKLFGDDDEKPKANPIQTTKVPTQNKVDNSESVNNIFEKARK